MRVKNTSIKFNLIEILRGHNLKLGFRDAHLQLSMTVWKSVHKLRLSSVRKDVGQRSHFLSNAAQLQSLDEFHQLLHRNLLFIVMCCALKLEFENINPHQRAPVLKIIRIV